MRKTIYEAPLAEVVETLPEQVIASSTGSTDDYNQPGGVWNW